MVADRLKAVQERIAAAARRVGRAPGDVTLVAVSKGHSGDAIAEAYEAGHRVFGESRAQELADKVGVAPGDIEWHFIGPLQRNKVRKVRPVVRLLHSMDRVELGAAWLKGPGPPPPVLLQVNIGADPAKHGVAPDATRATLDAMVALGLDVRGLMTIPPYDPAESGRWFDALAALRDELAADFPGLRELSMGMTEDFETAVERGSTIVRVGRAIFGPRNDTSAEAH